MAAESTATTVWQGDLAHGSGVTEPASGAFGRVAFVAGEGVKSSHLVVVGRVAGIDADTFAADAAAAGSGCPISGALAGNVEITVDATLET